MAGGMSDDYQFDDDGGGNHDATEPTQAEIDSPAVDHFTELMETGTDAAIEAEAAEQAAQDAAVADILKPRVEIVHDLTFTLAKALQDGIKQADTRVLVREAQLAVGQLLVNLADHELAQVSLDEFEITRNETLNVIATMGDYVMAKTPTVEQLAAADVATETKQ